MAPASTKLKKRGDDYHHGDLRNALLAAARRTLDEGDYETLSLRELARRAGVSANAPYRHFSSKDEILAHVAAGGFHDLSARFDALHCADPVERLVRMSDVYTGFACEQPAMYRVMFGAEKQALTGFPVLQEAGMGCFGRLVAAVAAATPAGMSPATAGASRSSPPADAAPDPSPGDADPQTLRRAVAVWSLVHGWSRLAIDGVTAMLPPTATEPASLAVRGIIASWR